MKSTEDKARPVIHHAGVSITSAHIPTTVTCGPQTCEELPTSLWVQSGPSGTCLSFLLVAHGAIHQRLLSAFLQLPCPLTSVGAVPFTGTKPSQSPRSHSCPPMPAVSTAAALLSFEPLQMPLNWSLCDCVQTLLKTLLRAEETHQLRCPQLL